MAPPLPSVATKGWERHPFDRTAFPPHTRTLHHCKRCEGYKGLVGGCQLVVPFKRALGGRGVLSTRIAASRSERCSYIEGIRSVAPNSVCGSHRRLAKRLFAGAVRTQDCRRLSDS